MKRQEALRSMEMERGTHVIVSKENIVSDLISIYNDRTILQKKIACTIEGEDALGDGVLREVYSLFWEAFLTDCDGYSEHPIPILPNLTQEDYKSIGRIITHQFLLCGTFPVKVSQACMQQSLFGKVADECKINSFLRLLPPRERDILSRALAGDVPFPTEEVIDLLEDYNVRQLPNGGNIKSIVLFVATSEFITKPFLCLSSMREGMGHLWDNVTSDEIASLYDKCVPTAARIIERLTLSAEDAREAKIYRWLQRYLKGSVSEILTKFLRFCTATDVLLPDHNIAVCTEVMAPTAIRPKSYTCFRKLILPRNYHSFSQMRNNLNFYLREPGNWDLNDL